MVDLTSLILETFRLNGELLTAGDRLVADLGLTSARWQVLGAVGMAASPQPVSQIARNMGLSRQAVQRLVNDMAAQDLLRFTPNPHHQRARLVLLTARGETVFRAAMQRQAPWAAQLGVGLTAGQIDTALQVLRTLRDRLQTRNETRSQETRDVEEFV